MKGYTGRAAGGQSKADSYSPVERRPEVEVAGSNPAHPQSAPRPSAAAFDHREVFVALAKEKGWKRGIELGLGHGLLFGRLIAAGIEMVGVDLGRRPDRRAAVEAIGGNVLWMPTAEASKHVEDGWADFVFIDAGHSYSAVKADIDHWRSKVRPGGWLGGHDYHPNHPGVIRAVDEAFPNRKLYEGWIWSAS